MITVTAGIKSYIVSFSPSPELDIAGYVIHASTVSGFTPSSANLIANGPDSKVTVTSAEGTFYVRVAAYDTFEDPKNINFSGLHYSSEYTVTVDSISEIMGQLTNQISESQLTQTLNSRIDLVDNPNTGLVKQTQTLLNSFGDTAAAATSASNAAIAEAAAVAAQTAAIQAQNAAGASAGQAASSASSASNSASLADGSASAAATSASQASTYKTDAQTASAAATTAQVAAQSANTDATQSASAASTSANSAATSATNAASAASAAAISATSASTSSSSAGTYATQASNSAGQAASSATAAGTSASNASNSASTAAAQASNASTYASNASNSATTAANSATTAGNSATSASNSASQASTAATNAGNSANSAAASVVSAASTYDAQKVFGTSTFFVDPMNELMVGYNGDPATTSGLPTGSSFSAVVINSSTGNGGGANAISVTGNTFSTSNISTRKAFPVSSNRTYRFTVWAEKTVYDGKSIYAAALELDSNYNYSGLQHSAPNGGVLTVSQGWVKFTLDFTPSAAASFIRIGVAPNYPSGLGTTIVSQMSLEDITESTSASNYATAASTSSSQASTSANAAGASATASANSATQAATSASNAGTYASNAASSAGQAASSSSTAGTYASNASGYASTAQSAASSANASANQYSAQYTLKVDANGKVAGIGLFSDSTTGSQVEILADKFAVVDPSNESAAIVPFVVQGGTTYLKNAMIQTADIGTLQIAGNAVTVPVSVYTPASIDIPTTYGSGMAQSATIVSDGSIILVQGSMYVAIQGSSPGVQIIVNRVVGSVAIANSGTQIYTTAAMIPTSSMWDMPISFSLTDQPSAGTYTYVVTISYDGGTFAKCWNRSLTLLSAKR